MGNAFRVPEIRVKIAFTLGILALYRLGAYIPAPGVDVAAVSGRLGRLKEPPALRIRGAWPLNSP